MKINKAEKNVLVAALTTYEMDLDQAQDSFADLDMDCSDLSAVIEAKRRVHKELSKKLNELVR